MARRGRDMDDPERLAEDALARMAATPQGRQLLLVLIVLALLAALAYGAFLFWQEHHRAAAPTATTPNALVRVASWNLRFFSAKRKVPPDLGKISQILISNHFDVVAIQEVKGAGEEVDKLLNALGPPWRGTSLSPETGNGERFVFVYNGDHVAEVGHAHPIAVPPGEFERQPYQATFKSGLFDFTLITCHLFYGKGKASDFLRRQREAEALANYARDLAGSDKEKDIIVLGDFNEQHERPNVHYFTDMGWENLIHDGSNLRGTEDFDLMLLNPRQTREWDGTSGSVHFEQTMFGNDDKQAVEEVSDHRPVYADFATNVPDGD